MSMETSAQARPKPVPSWEQFTADFTTEYDSNKYVCFYLFILFMYFFIHSYSYKCVYLL